MSELFGSIETAIKQGKRKDAVAQVQEAIDTKLPPRQNSPRAFTRHG
jgi:hypothetical protein